MEFKFTEDCLIGVEAIDEEHRYLFHIMNQIYDFLHSQDSTVSNHTAVSDNAAADTAQTDNQLEEYIEQLKEYGTLHFAHEEAYMEKIGDPELLLQKRAHTLFMEKLNSLDISYLQNDEKRAILKDMLVYLTKWLYQHILGSDTLIGKIQHIEVTEENNPCEFTSRYRTGIDFVDEEHQGLFEIMGRAYLLLQDEDTPDRYDEIMGILDELVDYTKNHFAHEEAYMEQIHDPNLEKQQRAHSIFLDRVEDRDIGENAENQQEFLTELLDFLFGWLSNHIMKMDKKIGA